MVPKVRQVAVGMKSVVVLTAALVCAHGNLYSWASSVSSFQEADTSQAELRKGIALTRSGRFREAIPVLLALEGHVADEFAVKYNLALCFVATGQPEKAIPMLQSLPEDPRRGSGVDNLLAQAYIATSRAEEAFTALKRAAQLTPDNEKLFLYIADACMAYQDYALGLKAMNLGLQQLPKSASLHYEKAVFLSSLDEFDVAKSEFDESHRLAPDDAIGYVAAAHKHMLEGDLHNAINVARQGVFRKRANYLLYTFLGQALIRSGAIPGAPEFVEARTSLERAVGERPNSADSRISLAEAYTMEDRLPDALAQLEAARQMEPRSAAVYASLAKVYRRMNKPEDTQNALSILHAINQEQVARIADAPGDRKAGYGRTPN